MALNAPFHLPAQGLFLSFEGIEGSGKSTQIQKLREHLTEQGREVLVLREPGGTSFGEKLRAALLGHDTTLDPLAETFVFLASRVQLLREKILPHLTGPRRVVLLDRYLDSTLVYQALAQGKDPAALWQLFAHPPLTLLPHATLFLDITVEKSLERQALRGQSKDYFESRHQEFQRALMEGYQLLARQHPERILTIDAAGASDEVFRAIITALSGRALL